MALLRWALAMGNPLFVLDNLIDPKDATPRVKRSDCAPLDGASWDEFLTYERSWTHANLWTTTTGELVVSLEVGRPIAQVPAGSVLTGYVHTSSRPLELIED